MTYARPIILRCYRPGLVGSLGYSILAADGTTVLVARSTNGIVERGAGEYFAVPNVDPTWGRLIVVRWTGGGVDASDAIDQGANTPPNLKLEVSEVAISGS